MKEHADPGGLPFAIILSLNEDSVRKTSGKLCALKFSGEYIPGRANLASMLSQVRECSKTATCM